MTNVWIVRASYGTYTKHFVEHGYAGIGFGMADIDLSHVTGRDELYPLYRAAHRDETSKIVIGIQVGQIHRFLFEIQAGDYIITPDRDTEVLRYGVVAPDPSYAYAHGDDGCHFRHRRRVNWSEKTLRRGSFSVPFQSTIRSSLTVFAVSQREEFLTAIGQPGDRAVAPSPYDPYEAVLKQILELSASEFEILAVHLLTAIGFEGSEVTGKSGDGGVDATGELNASNLVKVKVFVQVKRYDLGTKVSAAKVKNLRQAIPFGGQGAFITTADYGDAASAVALDPHFPRIGLINGGQLVDLLVKHWYDIPEEFRQRLGLTPGLVLVWAARSPSPKR